MRSNDVDPDPRVEKTAKWLSERYDVHVLGWKRNNDTEYPQNSDFSIDRFGKPAQYGAGYRNLFRLLGWNFQLILKLVKLRRKYKYIHACDFDTIIPCFFVAKILSKKVVYDIFDYFVDSRGMTGLPRKAIKTMEDFFIRNSDALILVDKTRYSQIPKRIPAVHTVVYNVPDISADRTQNIAHENIIVYVGVLQKFRFLEELCDVISNQNRWSLKIAGFGPLEELVKKKAAESEAIEYLGKLNYESALKLNKTAKVMLAIYDPKLPNHRYSSPNKLFESLALGKILIVAEDTSVDQTVKELRTGFCFNYEKPSEFLEILDQIERFDEFELEEIYSRAVRGFEKYYSPSVQKTRLWDLYANIK